jgi:DnaK suppressor protein
MADDERDELTRGSGAEPEARHEIEQRLRALIEELEGALRAGAAGTRTVELDQAAVGRLSRMDALQQQAVAQASQRNVQARLQRCRAALSALEAGRYGLCRECDEPIERRRLEAFPEVALCLSCQREKG